MIVFNLNYLFNDPISKYGYIPKYQSSDFNTGILSEREQNSAHNNYQQQKKVLINFEENRHTTIQFKCELRMR